MNPDGYPDDIARDLMSAIAKLPADEQCDAVLNVLNGILQAMPTGELHDVRREIADIFTGSPLEVVRRTLDMIDGQLALREMGVTP